MTDTAISTRYRCTRNPLPTCWLKQSKVKSSILLEADIGVNGGRLRAKLLVFRNRRALWKFWTDTLDQAKLGRALGAVTRLSVTRERINADMSWSRIEEVDRRYFCLIGLVHGYLSMEIIAHEAVHAGYAWLARRTRSSWDRYDFAEEALAYPVGRIAAGINRALHKAGAYQWPGRQRGTE